MSKTCSNEGRREVFLIDTVDDDDDDTHGFTAVIGSDTHTHTHTHTI